ncbi:MAG: FkbM family methyltransferase [Hyphomicrobiales bacterium]
MFELAHDIIRRLPDFRGKKRLLKSLLPYLREVRSFYGPKLTVSTNDNTFYASYFARYGSELENLIKVLPETGTFIDFGSNQGIYSLIAGHHLKRGTVWAIEPNPIVYCNLVRNIQINDLDNVVALNFSISAHTSVQKLHFSDSHTGKGNIGYPSSGAGERSVNVSLFAPNTFRDIMTISNVERSTVLCKIDTEGAEVEVLKGLAASGLLNQIGTFHIEIDERYLNRLNATTDNVYDLLLQNGFIAKTDRRGAQHYDEIFVHESLNEQIN